MNFIFLSITLHFLITSQLGDNFSKWQYMYFSIQGILQFQLFQIPFVGADTCGFSELLTWVSSRRYADRPLDGNTDEELCNRWMQLSAFTPFYRNHNIKGAIPQEPYRWPSVANASRSAIATRYSLLPYWVRTHNPSDVQDPQCIAVHSFRKCVDTRNTSSPCAVLRIS
jgi:alpha-glucosidase (family GH31 glycosyl hydrolase)